MFSSFLKGLTSIFVSDDAAVYTDHQFTDWTDRIWVVELNSEKVCSQDLLFNLFAEYLNQFGYVSLRYSLSLVSQGRPGTPAQGRMLQSAVGLSKTKIRILQVRFSDEHQTQLEYFEPLFFGFGSKLAGWKFIATQPAPATIPLVSTKVADGLALLVTENCTYNRSSRTYTARLEDSVKFPQLLRALDGHFTSSGLKKGKTTSSSIELLNEGKLSGARLTLGTNSSKQSVLRATWDDFFLPTGGPQKFFQRCDKVLAHNLFLAGSPPLRTPPPYPKKKANPSLAELADQGKLKEGQKLDHRVMDGDVETVYTATFKKKGADCELVDDASGKSFASAAAWTSSLRKKGEKRLSLKQFLQEEKAREANIGKKGKDGNARAKDAKDGKDSKASKDEKAKKGGSNPDKSSPKKPQAKEEKVAVAEVAAKQGSEKSSSKSGSKETDKESAVKKSVKPKGSKADSLLERENKVLARKKKRVPRKKPTQDGGPVGTPGRLEDDTKKKEPTEETNVEGEKESPEVPPVLPAEEKAEEKAEKAGSASSEPREEEKVRAPSPEPPKAETSSSSSSSSSEPKPADPAWLPSPAQKAKSKSSSSSSDPKPQDPKKDDSQNSRPGSEEEAVPTEKDKSASDEAFEEVSLEEN